MRAFPAVLVAGMFLLPMAGSTTGLSFEITRIPRFGGEPNLEIADDGTVYVVYPDWPGSRLWRRAPGASHFQDLGRPNLGVGGGDEDVAVGPDGLVAVVGMYWESGITRNGWCTSVTVSRDGGDTWHAPVHGVCAEAAVDRPYVAIDDRGAIWVLQHAYCCVGQHSVHYSLDGVTFVPTGVATPIGGFPGNVFVADGRLFAASGCALDTALCVSSTATDLPQPVWTPAAPLRVPAGLPGLGHSTAAVDDAGNIYLSWTENAASRTHVRVARSTDGGLTWSAPERVSGGNAATFPWIVAGADGRVAVAWYEADVAGNPNTVLSHARWNVHLAVRGAWDAPWEKTVVSATPNHRGPLCMNGLACHAQGIDRDLLDYFELAVGPDGGLHVVWSDDEAWVVQYAEQKSGTRLR